MPHIDSARLVYLGILLVALTGWLLAEYRGRMGVALRGLLAWGMILLGLVALYGMWGDIRRDIKPVQELTASGSLTIPRAADGHYYPRLKIGGTEIVFMADTGASGVVLTPHDAKKLGIDVAHLAFVNQATTANGVVGSATVHLSDVTLGPFHDADIIAQVNQVEMDTSLLGMDYLGRFSLQIAGDQMQLRR